MYIALILMLCGMAAGRIGANLIPAELLGRIIFAFVLALLFLLGAQIGADASLLRDLSNTGWQALLLTLGAMAGSIICIRVIAAILRRLGKPLPGRRDA